MAYGLESGKLVNLTEVAGGVDFEDKAFDRPVEKPTYGVGGWSEDGASVFLNHEFDVWQVPLKGGEATNLTGGMGDREEIQFRIMDLDPGGRRCGDGMRRFSVGLRGVDEEVRILPGDPGTGSPGTSL